MSLNKLQFRCLWQGRRQEAGRQAGRQQRQAGGSGTQADGSQQQSLARRHCCAWGSILTLPAPWPWPPRHSHHRRRWGTSTALLPQSVLHPCPAMAAAAPALTVEGRRQQAGRWGVLAGCAAALQLLLVLLVLCQPAEHRQPLGLRDSTDSQRWLGKSGRLGPEPIAQASHATSHAAALAAAQRQHSGSTGGSTG